MGQTTKTSLSSRQRASARAALGLAAGFCGLVSACGVAPGPDASLPSMLWIDRYDWRTAADIQRVVKDAADLGFDPVLFQVRGNGTALWRSALEVWSERFEYKDPGFDPLEVALQAAHGRGLKLHAWFNVMPGWRGEADPADERQLLRARPGWFIRDAAGRLPPRGDGSYLGLNPCLPEVREYLASLCRELVLQYPGLDGLHLDYVRFPEIASQDDSGVRWPGDLRTLQEWSEQRDPPSPATDPAGFAQFQRDCVTKTVAAIADAVQAVSGRSVQLTAAVFADPKTARHKVRQDWPTWAQRGLVDGLMPMNYTDDNELFTQRTRTAIAHSAGVPVIPGIGLYKLRGGPQAALQQVEARDAGAAGVAVFGYREMDGKLPPEAGEKRAAMEAGFRRAVSGQFRP